MEVAGNRTYPPLLSGLGINPLHHGHSDLSTQGSSCCLHVCNINAKDCVKRSEWPWCNGFIPSLESKGWTGSIPG
jgi:hypothetical protein